MTRFAELNRNKSVAKVKVAPVGGLQIDTTALALLSLLPLGFLLAIGVQPSLAYIGPGIALPLASLILAMSSRRPLKGQHTANTTQGR